jgi:hypothetical protein
MDSPDWLASTEDERKALYRIVKQVRDETGLTWTALYRQALGRPPSAGIGYEDNFRAGRIGKTHAHRLYAWLQARHPRHAQALDKLTGRSESATGLPLGVAWRRLVQRRAEREKIELIALGAVGPPGRVSAARRRLGPVETYQLGRPFQFKLDSPIAGHLVAFVEHRFRWSPLDLAEDGHSAPVDAGVVILPQQDGQPVPLAEHDDPGLHRFLFITVTDQTVVADIEHAQVGIHIPIGALDALAITLSTLDPDSWAVAEISIEFRR